MHIMVNAYNLKNAYNYVNLMCTILYIESTQNFKIYKIL